MPSSAQTGCMEGIFLPRSRAGEDVSGAGNVLLAISLYYRRIIYKYFQCHSFYGTLREMVILNNLPEKERYK